MKTYKIAAIPGDGIGTEVVDAGVEVLEVADLMAKAEAADAADAERQDEALDTAAKVVAGLKVGDPRDRTKHFFTLDRHAGLDVAEDRRTNVVAAIEPRRPSWAGPGQGDVPLSVEILEAVVAH